MVRAWANVSMIGTTLIKDRHKYKSLEEVPRDNLICKINYVAQGKELLINNNHDIYFIISSFKIQCLPLFL